MLLRLASPADLGTCLALNADSQTDHVWQMDEREENGGIAVRFQTVRLPRVMRVAYPRPRDDLLPCWEKGATVLVASDKPAVEPDTDRDNAQEGADPARVFGYCQLDTYSWQGTGWISHLIIDRPYRRRGIGTAMLKASVMWGKREGLQRLMVAVQTKNYPGICFCEKRGFVFCGCNDQYFPNRDIALFFSLRI